MGNVVGPVTGQRSYVRVLHKDPRIVTTPVFNYDCVLAA